MIDAIFITVYIIGWLWGTRFAGGAFFTDMGYDDAIDLVFAVLIGLCCGFGWPRLLVGRLAYVGWVKYVPDNLDYSFAEKIFPAPKPVESYSERKQLKAVSEREELEMLREWAKREKELV